MKPRLVCLCNMVSEQEIQNALKKGARSTSDIQRMTRAGTSCGRCLPWIDSIVEDFLNQLDEDPQLKLRF